MTRPISARTRADAIAICEQRHDYANARYMVCVIAEHIGAVDQTPRSNGPAFHLAFDAWRAVPGSPDSWLEASGLLRDGWCPSGWDVVAKAVTP